MRRVFFIFIALLIACQAGAQGTEAARTSASSPFQRILVISTFQLSHPWTKKFNEALDAGLCDGGSKPYSIDHLELNSVRDRTGGYEEKFNAWLPRIQRGDYAAVVALLDDAVMLTMKNYDKIPTNIPLILCGDYRFDEEKNDAYENVILYGSHYELEKSMDLACKLYPDLTDIVIVTDSFAAGKRANRDAQRIMADFTRARVTLLSREKYTTRQMLDHIEEMPPNTVVFFAPWRDFGRDGFLSLEQVAAELRLAARRPFFIFTNVLIGHGALGGYVNSGDWLGEDVAKKLERLLQGGRVTDVPRYFDMPSKCVIDMNEFYAEKLDASCLPDDAVLLNVRASFTARNPHAVLFMALGGSGGILLILCGIWYWHRRNMRHLMQILEEVRHEKQTVERIHYALLESGSSGILITDSNFRILTANTTASDLLARDGNTLSGRVLSAVMKLYTQNYDRSIEIPENGCVVGNCLDEEGVSHHYEVKTTVLKNDAYETLRILVNFRDITKDLTQRSLQNERILMLEKTAELFHCSYIELTISGTIIGHTKSALLNWRFVKNKPVAPADWVHPDDLDDYTDAWKRINSGVVEQQRIEYRSLWQGEVHYYVMEIRRIPDAIHNGEPVFGCSIQDVSEFGAFKQKMLAENQMFRNCLESLPFPTVLKDPYEQYRYVWGNHKFCEMTGLQSADIKGKTDFELFENSLAQLYRRNDLQTFESKETQISTDELPGANRISYMKKVKTLVVRADGRDLIIAVGVDITEMHEAQRALENAEHLLQLIFDNLPVGLFLKDPENEFRYLRYNASLCRYVPISVFSMAGKSDYENPLLEDHAAELRAQDEKVMRENEAVTHELSFSYGEGNATYLITKIPLQLPDGKRYLLGCCVDVSELRLLADNLQQSVARYKEQFTREQISNVCLQIVCFESNFNEAIKQLLSKLGGLFDLERCFIRCKRRENPALDHDFYWPVGEPASEENGFWDDFEPSTCPDLWAQLQDGGVCRIEDFQHSPGMLKALEQYFNKPVAPQSVLLHGIFDQRGFYGLIAMTTAPAGRSFSESDEEVIKNCGRLFLLARERAMREIELRREKTLQDMVSSNFEIPIILFDASGKMLKLNKAGYEKLEISEAEALSLPCHETICRSPVCPVECPVKKVLTTHRAAECDRLRGDREYHIVAKPIFDENDGSKLLYVLESGLDITAFTQTRKKLLCALEEAKAGERAKSNFISTMNHELRTPLNAVIGFSELLMLGSVKAEEQQEYVANIHKSGKMLLGLLNDILDISQVDSGFLTLQPAKMDLNKLFAELGNFFQAQAQEKQLEFKIMMPALLPELYLDAARMRQIFLNLIGNAIKFTRLGEVCCTALFDPDGDQFGTLKITVEDTGIGINEKFLPHIFDPFMQDEQVRESRAYQGSGLGLTIAKKLLDAMGGEITVSSCENIGSVFTVILKQVKYEFSGTLPQISRKESSFVGRLLLVDDLPMNLKILEKMLKKMGCECVTANSGARALELLRQEKFDIVLTDIWMPDMDGVELAGEIRRNQSGRGSKIFAITADAAWENTHGQLFDRVLKKPVSLEQLASILTEAAALENSDHE